VAAQQQLVRELYDADVPRHLRGTAGAAPDFSLLAEVATSDETSMLRLATAPRSVAPVVQTSSMRTAPGSTVIRGMNRGVRLWDRSFPADLRFHTGDARAGTTGSPEISLMTDASTAV